jgi:hypothetical protein
MMQQGEKLLPEYSHAPDMEFNILVIRYTVSRSAVPANKVSEFWGIVVNHIHACINSP